MKIAKLFSFNNKRAKEKTIAVSAGACTISGAAYLSSKYLAKPYINWVIHQNNSFSNSELNACKNQIRRALDISGLKAKGVVVNDISFKNIKDVAKEISSRCTEGFNKSFWGKLFKTFGKFKQSGNSKKISPQTYKMLESFAKGENAGFVPFANSIIINTKKIPHISFHEMGHALNANMGKFTKSLLVSRTFAPLFIPVIAITALLKNKKSKDDKPKGNFDKTSTFIKENAGKLTFACFIPMLLEEGLASIKGGNIAKKVLSKDIVKKINKSNLKSWGTYAIAATIMSCSMSFGIYVKDNMFKNKEYK